MLGFGAFFWFFVIAPTASADRDPDVIKYVLTQSYIALNCLMLLAFGILLMHAGAGAIARRTLILLTVGFSTMSLADIVWALAKVTGGYQLGGLSDTIYLTCYAFLIAAAREQLRGAPDTRQQQSALGSVMVQGMPYVAMLVSFLVLVYVEKSSMSSPATAMTVIIFALTLLVMLRQGVMSREDALLRERRAAGIVEARYASLIKNASDVIMIADVDGRLRFASPAAERTFGMHPDDLVGRNLLDLWAESDRERLAAFLAEVTATRGRTIGPVEVVVGNGARRSTLETVGSNLLEDPAIAGLALNFRDVSERKALEEQLRQLAFHDSLTLLANRSLFRNRVQHSLALAHRARQRVAVMFLDLDNFKNVNDSLGHDAGDRLLQAVAQRLVKSTRPSDTVARLGGDEFAILLEGIAEAADVERIAATITRSFDEPLLLDGSDTYVAASIGIAFSEPEDDTEQLLRNADIAMYNAKAAGKARFVVFQPLMQEQLRERLRLEEDITRALERGEFFLEYQPVIDLAKRELLGVEALVRWNHPDQGLVMPGAFIAAAEESGQIVELGRWVLTEACRAVQGLARQHRRGRGPAGRGQHLGPAPAACRPRGRREERPRDLGPRARKPRDRADREHDHAQHRRQPGALPRAQGARRAPRDRRLRHGLLVALLPAPLPDRHPQDRPLLRRPADRAGRRAGARARGRDARRDARPRDRRRGHRARGAGREAAGARLRRGPGIPVRPLEPAEGRVRDAVCRAARGTAPRPVVPGPADRHGPLQRRRRRRADALGRLGTVTFARSGAKGTVPSVACQTTSPAITVITGCERGIVASGIFHPVRRVHAEVRELAGLDRAALVLLERGVGAARRQDRERFLAREALVEPPVRSREALERPARDRGIELDARVAGLDRRVRAARDPSARGQDLAPGVGAADALRPETRRREQHVADRVRGLHRRDHAELREARDVGVREDLCMLDAEARVRDGPLARRDRGERLSRTGRARRDCRGRRSRASRPGSRAAAPRSRCAGSPPAA